ncbi:MAG: methyltransferase domain-containing protein [Halofilum sp. (in: g-proteobacteria)]|nr:methyltransferase domain-containing protein [Halofilum sp. (in: g-proteobacteria)]
MGDSDGTAGREPEYEDESIAFLEALWGDGYLSPGGPEEVRAVLDGLDLEGRTVLDLGCGSGGITLSLVEDYGAGRVIGADVEEPVIRHASERARARGLDDCVEFVQIEPGPLPFPDAAFDVFFSKDAMIHVPDKEALFADAFRLLVPGGWLAASDWLTSHDDEPSAAMRHYLDLEGLSFNMASPQRYRRALERAGFTDVSLHNRNPWYRGRAREELDAMRGPQYDRLCAAAGRDTVDHNIGTWGAMVEVLESGEHCPHHLRARKPA